MVWAEKTISIIGTVELDIGVCSSFPLLTLPRPHPLSPSLSHLTLSLSLTVSRSLLRCCLADSRALLGIHVSSLASASPASLALVSLRVRFGPLSEPLRVVAPSHLLPCAWRELPGRLSLSDLWASTLGFSGFPSAISFLFSPFFLSFFLLSCPRTG